MLTGTDQGVVERMTVWNGRKNGCRIHLGRCCQAKMACWVRKMLPVPSGDAQSLTQRSWANSNERELSSDLWRWHVWDSRQHRTACWLKKVQWLLPSQPSSWPLPTFLRCHFRINNKEPLSLARFLFLQPGEMDVSNNTWMDKLKKLSYISWKYEFVERDL